MQFSFRSDDFRKRFAALFEAQGWLQIPFAERVTDLGWPMSQSRVSAILNGRTEPSMRESEVLAAALGVSPAYLVFNIGGRVMRKEEGELAKKFPAKRVLRKVDPDAPVIVKKRG